MNRYDPWVHHAVAHVMETQGRLEEGIAWMEPRGHLGKLQLTPVHTIGGIIALIT